MSSLQVLLDRLDKPYPQVTDPFGLLRRAVIAGGFVSLLNLFFQPFGLSAYQHPYRLWVMAGFGLPVFFWVLGYGLLVQRGILVLRSSGQWRVRHQMLLNLLITGSISITIFFYARAVQFEPFSSVSYLISCSLCFSTLIVVFFLFFDKSDHLTRVDKETARESAELRILVRESHHRMRNHLQVISSILRLQTNTITDARALDVLRTNEARLESIAMLHEKLYCREASETGIPDRVFLRDYLEALTRIIARNHQELAPPVTIRVADHTALSVSPEKAVPLGLIVNELVTNSFKYAFNDLNEGKINLTLANTADGRHQLTVCDNGPGLPTGSIAPSDIDAAGKSLGMTLVRALAQQLRGELSYHYNRGAEFVIRF